MSSLFDTLDEIVKIRREAESERWRKKIAKRSLTPTQKEVALRVLESLVEKGSEILEVKRFRGQESITFFVRGMVIIDVQPDGEIIR